MATDDIYDELEITRYSGADGFQKVDDPIVRESSIRVFVNEREIVVLSCLKHDLRELAIGFLYTEVFINDISAVKSVEVKKGLDAVAIVTDEEGLFEDTTSIRSVTSSCGRSVSFINPLEITHFPVVESSETISAEWVSHSMENLTRTSTLFKTTGGVHTAALSDGENIVYVADDIGRHNCIDKVIGWALLNLTVDPERRVILSSGRLCAAIVSKAVRGRVPFVISHSAPTVGAIQLAEKFGITLIGFVRGGRFNIYSHPERVTD